MSGKFTNRTDFSIPESLIDEHEWMSDALIDGPLGAVCTLYYPDLQTECPNCLFDPQANRSANIYRTGGPNPFPNDTLCPYCGGTGVSAQPVTDTMRVRAYWGGMEVNAAMRQFQNMFNSKFVGSPDGVVFIIGYMNDAVKFQQCTSLVVNKPNVQIRCERASDAIPWGFRHNRYFAAMLNRK